MTDRLFRFGESGDTFGGAGDVFGASATPPPPPPVPPVPPPPPGIDLESGSRLDLFDYTVVDPSLNTLGQLHPVVTVNGQVTAPRLRASTSGNANRVMSSFLLTPDEAATFDPRQMRVIPSWVDADGTRWPMGVLRLIDVSVVEFSGGDRVETTFADDSAVHHSPTTRGLTWPAGTPVADIVDQLAGILDVAVLDADPTTAELGEPLSYPAGSTDWWDVYNAVAQAAGMLTPFFTLAGAWRWRNAPDWETVQADHVFSTDPTSDITQRRVVQQSLVTSVSLFDSPNVFHAVNNASRGSRIVGTYRLPASAPNSVERTGVEVASYVEVTGLGSQAAADAAARASSAESLDDVGGAQMESPLDPRVELFDTIEADGLLYRMVGWSAVLLAGRPQSHDMRRVYRTSDPDGPYLGGVA